MLAASAVGFCYVGGLLGARFWPLVVGALGLCFWHRLRSGARWRPSGWAYGSGRLDYEAAGLASGDGPILARSLPSGRPAFVPAVLGLFLDPPWLSEEACVRMFRSL